MVFGEYNIGICRIGFAAVLMTAVASAVPNMHALAQTTGAQTTGAQTTGAQSGETKPWKTLSGEEQIRRFYLPRAQAGDATAQYYLGHMYQNGLGVKADKQAAAEWFGRAADQDDPRALYRLAVMLQTGDGIPKAPSRALALYRRAAEQGVLEAYFNMAQMIERGEGVAANPSAAEGMFEQLADAGMTEAMRELGRINARKQDPDLPAAWFWFAFAAANGDSQAGELARLLAASMSEEDLAAGQTRLGKSLNN
ncbi:sel1 repeat family protein [Hwanghaeella grinnelliae]|uniref:Sel1 repeat family protein n=1 Tax=Hwanghaeella grinnelliae TaxID=2500179 RepID=A0A3S2VMI6_9PROT|nr:tetratricopeptide repeat protein [Hwanghaeella grinnelliae]RVU33850.1 sel1 repeat family protein [Hwanghaeella grinnelliae]